MKLAIMQPYLLPYIGYFQLLNAVDVFLIYDDVQFVRKGWQHRNRILVNGCDKGFSLPLEKAPQKALINERTIAKTFWEHEQDRLLRTLQRSYAKAPYFEEGYQLALSCFRHADSNLSGFVEHSIRVCCEYLGIHTKLIRSSTLDIGTGLRGQDRILALCRLLDTRHYINPIGGLLLYDRNAFREQGIHLSFLRSKEIQYEQFAHPFVPWLSIVDIIMFNPIERISEYLHQFELV